MGSKGANICCLYHASSLLGKMVKLAVARCRHDIHTNRKLLKACLISRARMIYSRTRSGVLQSQIP